MKRRVLTLLAGFFLFSTATPHTVNAWLNYQGVDPHHSTVATVSLPRAVPVPGTNVYIAPEYDDEIIFYHDYWYRVNNGSWDMARDYNGPWTYIPVEQVPVALLKLPTDYRRRAATHVKITYIQLKSNWKAWEEEKHWDGQAATEFGRHYRGVSYEHGVKEH